MPRCVSLSAERCVRYPDPVLSVAVSPDVLEADLAAGRLRCPGCDGPLRAWGYARERQVRTLHDVQVLRPRRACCGVCDATHVLLPALAVPRRRDAVEVIGHALLGNARGEGHRRIAARLDRPPGTVRGWLRAFARRADAITSRARSWARTLDNTFLPGRNDSPVAEAVNALGEATRLVRYRLRMRATPWELSVMLTGGLLHGPVRRPELGL